MNLFSLAPDLWVPALALAVAVLGWLLHQLDVGGQHWVSPDGAMYLRAGRKLAVPSPYARRWLLPMLLRDRVGAWRLCSTLALVAIAVLMTAYVPGEPWQRVVAAALLVGCHGIFRVHVLHPVLVDAPGLALALASAFTFEHHPLAAVALAALSGSCVERGPVFAAIYAGHPLLLLGLFAVPRWRRAPAPAEPWLREPFRYARRHHLGTWLSWRKMLLPWGVLAILAPLGAALDRATLIAALAVVVGYGQLLVATDRERLYLWAAPPVIVLAVRCLPLELALLATLAHWFTPTRPEDVDLFANDP